MRYVIAPAEAAEQADEGFESEAEEEEEVEQSTFVDSEVMDAVKDEKKRSQTGQSMEEFASHLPRLLELILEGEASDQVLQLCSCNSGLQRRVQCHDCFNAPPTCEECFIRTHARNPLHWPKVWQPAGHFQKMDISCLRNNTYSIHICTLGTERCAIPGTAEKVTIVDTNGIYGTRLCYCNCSPRPSHKATDPSNMRLEQLMRARLFPASIKYARTMFTFRVMDTFSEHNLASKKSAYDFVCALMRLTDGCFTSKVPDPYSQFLLACRVWRRLCLDKWTGQAYNLGAEFPHRTPGTLVLFCPACPEDGFNMEQDWERTPEDLKHLNQLRCALDGNFHLNQYKKNSDPNDIYLENAKGIGYFPDKDEEKEYLGQAPEIEEKSTCNYLNVVNNQNKKKFKNMKYSGVVNVACSHSFIRASVNLTKGEGFRFTDLALKHSLSHTRHIPQQPSEPEPPAPRHPPRAKCAACDFLLSYDCNCQYCVNLHTRFSANFPGYVDIIDRMRCSIPSLHIKDHKIDCLYMFNNAYMPSGGHHYGEYVEHGWWVFNELGGAVRQMNSGHREGVLMAHYTFSNWIHTTGLPMALLRDYNRALKLSKKKKEEFTSRAITNHAKVAQWEAYAAKAATYDNGISKGIYQHALAVPSKDQVYQQLVNLTTPEEVVHDEANVPLFLIQQALYIEHSQERIRGKLRLKAQTETVLKEVRSLRKKLLPKLETFREAQASVVPGLSELVTDSAASEVEVEDEVLHLPSDFGDDRDGDRPGWCAKARELPQMKHLRALEIRMREGDIYDAIKNVQHSAKSLSIHYDYKTKNIRGSNASTRSVHKLEKIRIERDCCINDYNRTRWVGLRRKNLPEMKEADTYRRPTSQPRQLGDSRTTDGQLYNLFPAPADGNEELDGDESYGDLENLAGTQATRRARGSRLRVVTRDAQTDEDASKAKKIVVDGWVWTEKLSFGAATRGAQDLSSFEEESDRVTYFRAKAEMERWREVREIIQSDFLNCLRAFERMTAEWSKMAQRTGPPTQPYLHDGWSFGHRAYAQRQAAMYQQLLETAQLVYKRCKFQPVPEGGILADLIAQERAKEDLEIKNLIEEEIKKSADLHVETALY